MPGRTPGPAVHAGRDHNAARRAEQAVERVPEVSGRGQGDHRLHAD